MTTESEMWSRVAQLTDRLTPDEKSSLEELDHGPMRHSIPFKHEQRLMRLGLAELSSGRLDLTLAGRHVLARMHGA